MLIYCDACRRNVGKLSDEKVPAGKRVSLNCPRCGTRIILTRQKETSEPAAEGQQSALSSEEAVFWDPVVGRLHPGEIDAESDHAGRDRVWFGLFLMAAGVGIVYLAGIPVFLVKNPRTLADIFLGGFTLMAGVKFFILTGPFLFLLAAAHLRMRVLDSRIKGMMSAAVHDKGWMYLPDGMDDTERLEKFKTLLPRIFGKGVRPVVGDECWGIYKSQQSSIDFWSGLIRFAPTQGQGRQVAPVTIFAIGHGREVTKPFELHPERRAPDPERDEEQTVGSPEFNLSYYFRLDGSRPNLIGTEMEEILTPGLQDALIELRRNVGNASVYFQDRLLVIGIEGEYLRSIHPGYVRVFGSTEKGRERVEARFFAVLAAAGKIAGELD